MSNYRPYRCTQSVNEDELKDFVLICEFSIRSYRRIKQHSVQGMAVKVIPIYNLLP